MSAGSLLTSSPDTPVYRKDLENQVFESWRLDPDNRTLQEELRRLLTNHAQAVMYSILRRSDPVLAAEATDKVLMNVGSFQGESLFTTWAHRIITTTMYDQRRLDRRRKEVSLEKAELLGGDTSLGVVDILRTVDKVLSADDFAIFEQIVLKGQTYQEAAESLHIPATNLFREWKRIQRVLRNALVK